MRLDARYERVREDGRLIDCAVLVAIGITADGKRRVLGVLVALSEAGVHWRTFGSSSICVTCCPSVTSWLRAKPSAFQGHPARGDQRAASAA
jgi:hypothetical protein